MVLNGWVYGDGKKRTTKIGRRTAHGKWGDSPDVPLHNWELIDTIEADDGDDCVCGMCEYMPIHFLHFLRHPGFSVFEGKPVKGIVAGRYCAPCMVSNGEKADIRDKNEDVKKLERRLAAKKLRDLRKAQRSCKNSDTSQYRQE